MNVLVVVMVVTGRTAVTDEPVVETVAKPLGVAAAPPPRPPTPTPTPTPSVTPSDTPTLGKGGSAREAVVVVTVGALLIADPVRVV